MDTDEAPINAGKKGICFIRVNPCPSVVQENFYHGWARINTDKIKEKNTANEEKTRL
jgi:hypothetical protein